MFAYAAADGNVGTKQFAGIPGPSYVSAGIPGRGYRPNNAFPLKNPGNAIADIGPIKGADANGVQTADLRMCHVCSQKEMSLGASLLGF